MNIKNKTHKIVIAAMFAALICVATMVIKIPTPLKGYINLGDCIVLLTSWALSPLYAFIAAGVGSALADLFSGYTIYAPATFIIKGVMVLIVSLISRFSHNKNSRASQIIGGSIAEVWMIAGYFVFEGILYGFAPALTNIPANGLQGIAGLVLGFALIQIFKKNKIFFK